MSVCSLSRGQFCWTSRGPPEATNDYYRTIAHRVWYFGVVYSTDICMPRGNKHE